MNDKEFRDIAALFAMQVLLKYDIELGEYKGNGRDWVASQAYKVADSMATERNTRS